MRYCSIDGCGKKHYAHGYCNPHYKRWKRHGDPNAGRTVVGEPEIFLREFALTYTGDECIPWPYSTAGMGHAIIWWDGRLQPVGRVICEEIYGPPPTPEHEAAHSCGRGDIGCVNANHLVWKTHVENEADKLIHGTHNRGERHVLSKLTEADVREIRRLRGKVYQKDLAERFGVVRQIISAIQTGRRWAWLP